MFDGDRDAQERPEDGGGQPSGGPAFPSPPPTMGWQPPGSPPSPLPSPPEGPGSGPAYSGWGQGAAPPPGGWPPAGGSPGSSASRRAWIALAAVVGGVVLLAAGLGIGWTLGRTGTGSLSPAAQPPIHTVPQQGGQSSRSLNVSAITNKVEPAVVDVNTVLASIGGRRTAQAAGTGMIVSSSGQVLTNNHVIQGATSIEVSVPGHGDHSAQVLGADPVDDVALLQVNGVSGLPTVTLADSSTLSVGQPVVAIGNALGQGGSPTVTEGTITALNRSITVGNDSGGTEHLSNLIQTDAPISQGDSGGPLVNAAGQVVGMITAGATNGLGQEVTEVGYAIPVNTAVNIVNQIRAGRASSNVVIGQPGYLGVEVADLNATTAAELGLNVSSGALVLGVVPGSPADQAGISRYSVITAVGGHSVDSTATLGQILHQDKPGQRVQVSWVDQSGSHTATVTLTTGPAV
jgi:S1-C subfamily serine protease